MWVTACFCPAPAPQSGTAGAGGAQGLQTAGSLLEWDQGNFFPSAKGQIYQESISKI